LDEKSFFIGLAEINPKYDNEIIRAAYDKAYELHKGQLRRSGEPYIIHPLNVALILARLGMDNDAIVGGLLHDVVEDCGISPEVIENEFTPKLDWESHGYKWVTLDELLDWDNKHYGLKALLDDEETMNKINNL
jgi:hypothetical protein